LMAASISKVGLVIGHLFFVNGKEMTHNSEHYQGQVHSGTSCLRGNNKAMLCRPLTLSVKRI
ncbi:hypothetical protein, partial [Microbulbifer thermotolerans]|uniref:hypothetical protein n=1 Tax=Microbulbifer thermotolerans TaxID=252514 RepID=UPI0022487762